MIIKSITLNNYRLYKGKNKISFTPKGDKNIYLISGENGFGKTTFLHSLIWCLYGRLMTEVEAEVRKDITQIGYGEFLKGNFNNEVRQSVQLIDSNIIERIKKRGFTPETEYLREKTQYSVTVDFGEVIIPFLPCTSLQIRRSFDMIQEKEQVDILVDGAKNELTNEIGAEVFINDFVLNKDIARFFFFDSEQIVALAETSTTTERRRLGSAYNEVLGVRKYEDLKKNLENVRLRFRRKSSDTKSRDKLLTLLDEKVAIENELSANKLETDNFENVLMDLRAKDGNLQLQLMREGNNATTKEIERLEKLIQATKEKDEEYKKKLKFFLEYAPLAMTGNLLKETKEQLERDYQLSKANDNRISRNMVVSDITADLLSLLSDSSLSPTVSLKLQEEVQDILSKYKQEIDINNLLLNMSDNDYDEFVAVYNHITTTYRVEFEHIAEDYKKNKQILERNARKLSNIQSKEKDELIKELRSKKNKLESEITSTDVKLRQLHEAFGIITQKLATLNKQISELSKIVSLDDSDAKKDSLAEVLVDELSSFLVLLKNEKKTSLERRIKAILNNLMHKEDFIGKVEVVVDGEGMDIELFTPDGNIINKDSLSKGEQQLYATSILKALVDESGIQFPVFIDSPLQKFDKSHATKIITEFYPQISKQVVLFPLLYKELTAEEYNVMKPLVNSTYLIKNDTTHSFIEQVDIEEFIKNS